MKKKGLAGLLVWLLLGGLLGPCLAAELVGQAVDAHTGAFLPGVVVTARKLHAQTVRQAVADSTGAYRLELTAGRWSVAVRTMGYRPLDQQLDMGADAQRLELRLQPEPLQMDELVVRARRTGVAAPTPGFVETLQIRRDAPSADLPALLEEAVGVTIKRYGGLGSFSTVSIRGSTAEQVLVYLDGVPLNQALGGGVDLGALPLGGVESIEVYRGAAPARFGGNSLGGVVHLRTRQATRAGQAHLHLQSGSFATRQLGLSAGAVWRAWQWLALADYQASDNDFRFWDDKGTDYNPDDDEWAVRANSDFQSLRTMAKIARPWGRSRLRAHAIFDLTRKGLPGIGNHQALHTRYDNWRTVAEMELYGPLAAGLAGYRLNLNQAVQQGEYRDLRGEVGIGRQHDRSTTRALGSRGELNAMLPGEGVLTVFAGARRETFEPENLLRRVSSMQTSRRYGALFGFEVESALGNRLQLSGGGQLERLDDAIVARGLFPTSRLSPRRRNSQTLRGGRIGGKLRLAGPLTLQGHWGRYGRAPGFHELFGNRGTVIGNTDLVSERGTHWDAGLVYRGAEAPTGLLLAEIAHYRHSVTDLIRFIQNSQYVSRPHNLGRARLQGIEVRGQARLATVLQASVNYTYQQAENRSPFPYERGKDLPNAPRHVLSGRLALGGPGTSLYYNLNRESRHFLDRANLRPVARRTVHTLGVNRRFSRGVTLAGEVRNLTANQIADLWGYPLPGRAYFVSLRQDLAMLFE